MKKYITFEELRYYSLLKMKKLICRRIHLIEEEESEQSEEGHGEEAAKADLDLVAASTR